MSKMWNDIVLSGNLIFPDEFIIRFLATQCKDVEANTQRIAVDLGCGAGRHLNLFRMYGFNAVGVDLYKEMFELAKINFPSLCGKETRFEQLTYDEYLEKGEKIDLVLMWGSLFLQPYEGMLNTMKKIYSKLNKGGIVCVDFRNKDTWFYALGKKVSDNFFILDERAKGYKDIHYSFVEKKDIEALASATGFKIENLELKSFTKNNLSEMHSWYQVILKKV